MILISLYSFVPLLFAYRLKCVVGLYGFSDSSSFVHVEGKANDDDDNYSDEKESLSFVILDGEEEQRKEEDSARQTSKAEYIQNNQEISETEICQSEEVNIKRETLENEILEAIRQAGLDDKFWIKKIREEFKVETVEELKNVTKEQIEVFLQNTETTIQSRLRPVFSNLIGVDVLNREVVNSQIINEEYVELEMKNPPRDDEIETKRVGELECKNTEPVFVAVTEIGSEDKADVIASKETEVSEYLREDSHKLGPKVTKIHDSKLELKEIRQEYSVEAVLCQAVKEAGLDDKVWVPKIQKNFHLKTFGQLKSLTIEQVEVYLQSLDSVETKSFAQVFQKLLLVDYSQEENITEKHQAGKELSAADIVNTIDDGILCRGILLTADIRKLLGKTGKVIEANGGDLEFSDTPLKHPIFRQEFVSQDMMRVFVSNIDKHMSSRSTSIGVNIWGVDLHDAMGSSDKEGSFVGSVSYQLVPVKSVTLSPYHTDLIPEVISAIQEVEQTMISKNYATGDYFSGFFEKYGSHIHSGAVEIGGMLVSSAECSGFREEDRSKVTDLVSLALEKALLLERTETDQSLNAYKLLGEVSGVSAEILQKITVTVNKLGGHPHGEKTVWKQNLTGQDKQWKVVNRSSFPKAIWQMLRKYESKFKDYERLADFMGKEWNRNIRPRQNKFEDREEQDAGIDSTRETDSQFNAENK